MANPFLVLGGVAVGIVVAAAGVLTVPGWIASAQDASAINDLANIANAQAIYRSTKGVFSSDIVILSGGSAVADGFSTLRGAGGHGGIVAAAAAPVKSGDQDPSFHLSNGVKLSLLDINPTGDAFCAVVQSPSGKYFATSELKPKSDGSTDIQTVLDNAQCQPEARGEFKLPDAPVWKDTALAGYFISSAYGSGRYVAVGNRTAITGGFTAGIMSSADGVTWEEAPTPGTPTAWNAVAYGNGVFVAAAGNGTGGFATSSDGRSWSEVAVPSKHLWLSVAFGGGRFVAVGSDQSKTDVFATSVDGVNWTMSNTPDYTGWAKVVFGNGMFVAYGNNAKIATSSDGSNWTFTDAAVKPTGSSVTTYADGRFVSLNGNEVMSSADGTTWSVLGTQPVNTGWNALTYANGKFVAVGINGKFSGPHLMTSTDALTWEAAPVTGRWTAVAYGNGCFIAVPGLNSGTTVRLCE